MTPQCTSSKAKVMAARGALSEALVLPPWADALRLAYTPNDTTAAMSSALHSLMSNLVWKEVVSMAHATKSATAPVPQPEPHKPSQEATVTPQHGPPPRRSEVHLLQTPSLLVSNPGEFPVPCATDTTMRIVESLAPQATQLAAIDQEKALASISEASSMPLQPDALPHPQDELWQLQQAYAAMSTADLSNLHLVVATTLQDAVVKLPSRTVATLSHLIESYAGVARMTVAPLVGCRSISPC
jgi:hypothetical protein